MANQPQKPFDDDVQKLASLDGASDIEPATSDAIQRVAEGACTEFIGNKLQAVEPPSPEPGAPKQPEFDEKSPVGDDEFAATMANLKDGSISAVWHVIERYEPHIRRVIRRRLRQPMRSKYDTMDFVQMVWKSFFEDPSRIYNFNSPAQLFGFLAKMAQHKVDGEMRRRTTTQKYDIAREQPLDDQQQHGRAPHDTPSQIAIARERWDHLVDGLSKDHREVVRLRLEGMTFNQISDRLSLDERTARRVLSRLTDQLAN